MTLQNVDDECHCYIKRKFTQKGVKTWFVSADRSNKRKIPESLVIRSALLKEIFDETEAVTQKIPIALSMEQAKSWLFCAKLENAMELAKLADETLLSAFKVRNTLKTPVMPYRLLHVQIRLVPIDLYFYT